MQPLNITVLRGGPSAERAVSLHSGVMVAEALVRCGHTVRTVDIGPDDLGVLETPADLFFICLHGAFGEDGQIQSILDARGRCYIGSGPAASALAIDKVATKDAWRRAGLPVPDEVVIEASEDAAGRREKLQRFGPPAVVKPVDGGSSLDVRLCSGGGEQLEAAVDDCLARYGRCMVERLIRGRELTVGILDQTALPVLEIRTQRPFYDYQAKYEDEQTEYIFSLPLADKLLSELQRLALLAHTSIGARSFSRVDLMLEADAKPYFLEINTIPGFTSHSLLPKAAAHAGIDFDALCERIVRMAVQA